MATSAVRQLQANATEWLARFTLLFSLVRNHSHASYRGADSFAGCLQLPSQLWTIDGVAERESWHVLCGSFAHGRTARHTAAHR